MNDGAMMQFLVDMKESLERELSGVHSELAKVIKRIDPLGDVYRRHSELIAADVLNVRAMERSVLRHDEAITRLSTQVAEMKARLDSISPSSR